MPFLEQYANYNFFTGRPVVGPGLDKLMPEAQATSSTGELARLMGETTGTSPVRIEHAVRGYFGTMGQYALQLSDIATRGITDGPPKPEMRIDEMPVVSRFMRDDPPRTTRYVTEYYRMKRNVDKAYNTLRHYAANNRTEKTLDLFDKKVGRVALYRAFQDAGRSMSLLRRVENQIRVSKDMTPGEKRRLLDKITKQRNDLAKKMVQEAPAAARLVREASKLPAAKQEQLAR